MSVQSGGERITEAITSKFRVGQKVRATSLMVPVETTERSKTFRKWVPQPRLVEGVFMGWRYKRNGATERSFSSGSVRIDYYPDDGGPTFHQSGSVLVALVVDNAFRKPMIVDPSSMESIE